MPTTQVRKDKKIGKSLVSLKGFALSPKFTRRDGYGARFYGQPAQNEPFLNDEHPEQAQIDRLIIGPGNVVYGHVQLDGTITFKVRVPIEAASYIDIAAVIEGYGRLTNHLTKKRFTFESDEAIEEGVRSCSKNLVYVRRGKKFVSRS